MGARQRLNSVYLFGVVIIAAVIGGAVQSWGLFFFVAIVLASILVHGGDIRLGPVSRRRGRRR